MIATDVDGLEEGPYAYYIPYELSRFASEIHVDVEEILLVFIGVHVAAVIFYLIYKKDNLITPMLKGMREVPDQTLHSEPELTSIWKSLSIMAAAFALTFSAFFYFG